MHKVKIFALPIFILLVGVAISASVVFAESTDDIVFPVKELGGCTDRADCQSFCDDPANTKECVAFAKKHNLLPKDDVERMEKFANLSEGPGGCTSPRECEAYCSDVGNIQECIAFAEEHGLVEGEELAEMRKVSSALERGVELPGDCTGKASCDTYCSEPRNMRECLAFAEAANLLPSDELEDARRVLSAIDQGITPPPCRGEGECDVYCSAPEHIEQCVAFAEAAGFMTTEEAAFARKTGGRGPGGCVRDECKTYCDEPTHRQECFSFAKEHGLISEEDINRAEESAPSFAADPATKKCFIDKLGPESADKLLNGNVPPSAEIKDRVAECFQIHEEGRSTEFDDSFQERPDELPKENLSEIQTFERPSILNNFPEGVSRCVQSVVGAESFEKISIGQQFPSPNFKNIVESCFKKLPSRDFAPNNTSIPDDEIVPRDDFSTEHNPTINGDIVPEIDLAPGDNVLPGDTHSDLSGDFSNIIEMFRRFLELE